MGQSKIPWNSSFSLPTNMLYHPSGAAWSMVGVAPKSILIGSEEGSLSLVDFRANATALSAKLCTDYIGGVAVCSNRNLFAAAAADGILRIYDARKFGETILQKDYDSPLRCCAATGDFVLCGAEDGNLHSYSLHGSSESPGPLLHGTTGGAINCISVSKLSGKQNVANNCSIGLGFEDGSVCLSIF
jgi:WD40 repeat protein